MNKDLKNRVFEIPHDILSKINHTILGLNGQHMHGLDRAKKLVADKQVKYGQLKRMIHDLQNIDKVRDRSKYDLMGGELMDRWAKSFLDGERDMVYNKKEGRKDADEMSAMTGERKNSFLKKHKKKSSFTPPTNLIKANSETYTSSLMGAKLFEEINKIKKLIIY